MSHAASDRSEVVYDPMVAQPEAAPALRPQASWGALLVGAVVAITIGLMLNTLGVAIGAGVVDATARDTPSATAMGVGAAIWFAASNIIGLFLGGMVAARLSGTTDRLDAAYHGLGAWAVAFLFAVLVMGQVGSNIAGRTADAVGSVARGAADAAGAATGAAASAVNPEEVTERLRLALSGPEDPNAMEPEQRGAEIASLIGAGVTQGRLDDARRARLVRLVSAEAGIPEAEAAQRVAATEAEARRLAEEAERRAREAADAAAKAAATSALYFFITMLLGAGAAMLGARSGTRGLVMAHRRAPL
ncbi:hypothetical protein [Sabulicella rubraurantiaca]|uniref:hypothetical protein n=1 Tax=Sabulicella rubraurantiaca TaxID=2811429 RepID=UPI001A95BABE|nr:hypothetical protein [Sabulicella rubraurantiaca]